LAGTTAGWRSPTLKDKERWMQLCEQASVEQDPTKLFELTQEIIRLLDDKEKRIRPSSGKIPEEMK
jgi:hypothetical protein